QTTPTTSEKSRATLTQTIRRLVTWHDAYCDKCDALIRFLGDKEPRQPTIGVSLQGAGWAGRFYRRDNKCVYSLAYAVLVGDEYEDVVAHEVAHSYAYQIDEGCDSHGELFRFVLGRVCKQDMSRCHYYSVTKAKMIGELLRMQLPSEGRLYLLPKDVLVRY